MAGFLALAALLPMACTSSPYKKQAKQVGIRTKEYADLAKRAHAGEAAAAETLAELWYFFGQDSSQAIHWTNVAVENGSKRASRLQKLAQKYAPAGAQLPETAAAAQSALGQKAENQ